MIALRTMALAIALAAAPATAQSKEAAQANAAQRGGEHDFDWEIGTWITTVRVLTNPLSGEAPKWAEFRGTSVVRPLLAGRANFVELSVSGPTGKIEGGSLRLYNPKARQWSLNYASVAGGVLTAPTFGAFDAAGRGVFYGQDSAGGRVVLVRFVISKVSPRLARFEQAFSADGGESWETNWIAEDTLREAG